MSKKMKLLIAVLVAIITLTVSGTVAVLAQDEEEPVSEEEFIEQSDELLPGVKHFLSAGGSDELLSRVAEILGISEDELREAFEQARQEIMAERWEKAFYKLLDRAVEEGLITEEEAEEIKDWWEQKPDALNWALLRKAFLLMRPSPESLAKKGHKGLGEIRQHLRQWFGEMNKPEMRLEILDKVLEKLYAAYLENDVDQYPVGPDYAAGLRYFLSLTDLSPLAVKGQITGPVTWGLTVTDETRRAILYDDVLGDAVPRFLRLKAGWQEKELKKICPDTIIFVDEPYMAAYGSSASAGVFSSPEEIVNLLEEVFAGINGLKGLHCCGNTDWSVLLNTNVDILSFDAYNYGQSLSLYPSETRKFLDRKGTIAWGIVPNDEESLTKESVASLKDCLEETIAPFTRNGIRFEQLLKQGLLTPSCGLASISEEVATHTLELLAELSAAIRKRYL